MRNIYILAKKEFLSYFYSPIAYVVMAAFLMLQGVTFALLVTALSDPRVPMTDTPFAFFFGGTVFYWFSIVFVVPLITMRLFADEKRQGTIEVLLTDPVTDIELVLGKYLSAVLFYIVMWMPTMLYIISVKVSGTIDAGPIATGYAGTILLGIALISLGLCASTLTKNQIIAAVISCVVIILLFALTFLGFFLSAEWAKTVISYISIIEHFQDFSKGIIDTRHVVFYFSIACFFLVWTVKNIQSREWKF